jgi:3-methyladenine DNA glycosylase/8-oxoguanine DNA glycosylase
MADGRLVVDAGRQTAELTADLVERAGIGPWTAGYVAMRVLGDPDVLLTGDLALRHGAAALGLPDDVQALTTRAERWRPFRSYAGMYLWRSCPPPIRATRPRADSRATSLAGAARRTSVHALAGPPHSLSTTPRRRAALSESSQP